jgi:hypothetical protein
MEDGSLSRVSALIEDPLVQPDVLRIPVEVDVGEVPRRHPRQVAVQAPLVVLQN